MKISIFYSNNLRRWKRYAHCACGLANHKKVRWILKSWSWWIHKFSYLLLIKWQTYFRFLKRVMLKSSSFFGGRFCLHLQSDWIVPSRCCHLELAETQKQNVIWNICTTRVKLNPGSSWQISIQQEDIYHRQIKLNP